MCSITVELASDCTEFVGLQDANLCETRNLWGFVPRLKVYGTWRTNVVGMSHKRLPKPLKKCTWRSLYCRASSSNATMISACSKFVNVSVWLKSARWRLACCNESENSENKISEGLAPETFAGLCTLHQHCGGLSSQEGSQCFKGRGRVELYNVAKDIMLIQTWSKPIPTAPLLTAKSLPKSQFDYLVMTEHVYWWRSCGMTSNYHSTPWTLSQFCFVPYRG